VQVLSTIIFRLIKIAATTLGKTPADAVSKLHRALLCPQLCPNYMTLSVRIGKVDLRKPSL